MNRPSRLKLSDVNPNLLCVLCGGYFIDATTIVECLHSFCKTCIVRYLETSKYCPICDVQVHKTKPLQNIRADHTLQNIVYKLVPGLYQNEMKQRQEFYLRHPGVPPVSEYDAGVINEETSCIYCPDETIALCLEYCGKASSSSTNDAPKSNYLFPPGSKDVHQHRRYFRCPAAVTVSHMKKLLRSKYGISVDHRVDIMYNAELLKEEYSLMDVAYIYSWKRKGVMRFTYRIFERPHKRRKLDLERCKTASNFVTDAAKSELLGSTSETKAVADSKLVCERLIDDQIPSVPELDLKNEGSEMTKEKCDISVDGGMATSDSGEQWKEVQLQISENGIMSVRNMDDLVSAVEGGMLSGAFNETIISSGKAEESSEESAKNEANSNVPAEKDVSKSPQKVREIAENSLETISDNQTLKSSSECSEAMRVKPQLSADNKDINGPSASALLPKTSVVDKMSEQRPSGGVRYGFPKKEVSSKPKDTNCKEVGGDYGTNTHPLESQPLTNSPQPCVSVATSTVTPSVSLMPTTHSLASSNLPSPPIAPKKSNSAPVGYKTLKTPPKTWNPSIPRSKVLANHSAFGKSGMGSVVNHNGSIGVPGLHAMSPSKPEARVDGKVNTTGTEGSGGVRLPPTSSPKPLRFFKMRNNMPRYLGNPSSGVKPMYSLHPGAGPPAPQVTPKSPLPCPTKVESKTNPSAQLPPTSSSVVPESKTDKSPVKAAFPVAPTSRSGHKPQSGPISQQTTAVSAGHSPAVTLQQSCAATSHTTPAQLPVPRSAITTQGVLHPPVSTMTTSSSSGYHPSLPPSISMIFGQTRPSPVERPTSQTPPPAVQRVPASVHHHPHHHFHHPVTPIHLLQHRQVPGKVNGELNCGTASETNNISKGDKSVDVLAAPVISPQSSEVQKTKDEPSREVAVKEPVNGKIEGSSVPATVSPSPVVDGKSMAPSKC